MIARVRRNYRDARQALRFAAQRVRQGWDTSAIWATDSWLTGHLGAVLSATADVLHGYPTDTTLDKWAAQHRSAGAALLAYHARYETSNNINEMNELERDAAEALRWVADNLSKLWD